MLLLIAAPDPAPLPDHSLASPRFEIEAAAPVGRLRAGLACLPARGLRWRDVKPDSADSAEAVAAALEHAAPARLVSRDEGFEDRPRDAARRIVPVVRRFEIAACSPKWGVPVLAGGRVKPWKGRGRMLVAWRIYDARSRSLVEERLVESEFELPPGIESGPEAGLHALAVNAAAFAAGYFR